MPADDILHIDFVPIPPDVRRSVRPINGYEYDLLKSLAGPFSGRMIREQYPEVEELEMKVDKIWDLNPHEPDCCEPVLVLRLTGGEFLYLTAASWSHGGIYADDRGYLKSFGRNLKVCRTLKDHIPVEVTSSGARVSVEKAVKSELLSGSLCEPLSPLFGHLSAFFKLNKLPPVLSGEVDQSEDAPRVFYLHPAHGGHPIVKRGNAIARWGCMVVLALIVVVWLGWYLL